jgi:hypothetical protein
MLATSVFSQDKDKIPDKMKERLDQLKKQEGSIEFYGKVIDQLGKPVADAKVTISIGQVSIMPRFPLSLNINTDNTGLFSVTSRDKITATNLSVEQIEKKGYVESCNKWPDIYISFRKDDPQRHIPDPNNPVIFHMRKMGENPTYLMTNRDFDFDMSSGEELVRSFIDLKYDWNETHENGDYEKDFLAKHYDIKVSAFFDKEKSDWTVTFTTSGESGGFVLDDKFLSEAPEAGYKKEFIFIQHLKTREWDGKIVANTTEFKLKNKYLYVKSREPAIYTRIEFTDDYVYADFETFRINANIATNPYGERNLEFNDELPPEVQGQLYVEIMSAFLKEERTQKSDINKMFDEFKKTHKPKKNTGGYTEWVEINE